MTGEATADTATETTETVVEPTEDSTDWKAEAEKWQGLARKHEDRAKTNSAAAKELDRVRQESMSDLEKAVDIARKEGRAEGRAQSGSRLVELAVKAAAAGRGVDVDALLEGLDRSRFLDDDGEPDTEAVQAWVDRIAPQKQDEDTNAFFPDLGQGVRSSDAKALNGDPLVRALADKVGAPRPR